MRGGQARGGEHGSAESEGESEDGVLPLDHFEGDAEIVENGHGSNVSVVSPVVSGQWSVVRKEKPCRAWCQHVLSSVILPAIWPSGAGWAGFTENWVLDHFHN
jgi:hypothetical protein